MRNSDYSGLELSGKYVLEEKIGAGGSGVVYEATDNTLQRRVAIKLLHEGLRSDPVFLKQFLIEAKSAAKLNHPHIVKVLELGDHQSIPFIVFELLLGGSLRDLLDNGHRLSVPQAVRITKDLLAALKYSNACNIVHRDIKPSNLLFDEDGHIRITDFGIARALVATTVSSMNGSMFGTPRYSSPEQMSNQAISSPTDIYSLALVVVESVTGILPFDSESAAGWQLRTLQDMIVPEALGPLSYVVTAMGRRDPDQRSKPQELIQMLVELERTLPTPDSIPVSLHLRAVPNLRPGEIDTSIQDRTRILDLRNGALLGLDGGRGGGDVTIVDPGIPAGAGIGSFNVDQELKNQKSYQGDGDTALISSSSRLDDITYLAGYRDSKQLAGSALGANESYASGSVLTSDEIPIKDNVDQNPKRRSLVAKTLVWLGSLAILAALILALVSVFFVTPHVLLPNLLGKTKSQAMAQLLSGSLKPGQVVFARSSTVLVGSVISEYPQAGQSVAKNSYVSLVISSGPPNVIVPGVVGDTQAAAASSLASDHLVSNLSTSYSETVATGEVISEASIGQSVRPGTSIGIVVSLGPQPRTVPNMTGITYAAAQSELGAIQLQISDSQQYSDTVPQGIIVSQTVVSGTQVPRGSTVGVVVSLGPHTALVPDLTGQSIQQAQSALAQVGLSIATVYGPNGNVIIILQDPAPGATVTYGSGITVWVTKQ